MIRILSSSFLALGFAASALQAQLFLYDSDAKTLTGIVESVAGSSQSAFGFGFKATFSFFENSNQLGLTLENLAGTDRGDGTFYTAGRITSFGFSSPSEGDFTLLSLSSSTHAKFKAATPSFNLAINGGNYSQSYGAFSGANPQGGGKPSNSIQAGQTGSFLFTFAGPDITIGSFFGTPLSAEHSLYDISLSFRIQSLPNGGSDAFKSNGGTPPKEDDPVGTPTGGLLAVPEPSTYALGGILLAGLAIAARRLSRR